MDRNRALTALLVLESFALFIGGPLASLGTTTPLYGAACLGFFVTYTLVIISPSVTAKVLAGLSMLLAVLGAGLRIRHPSVLTIWFGHAAVIAALTAISTVIARVVFGPGRVTHYRLQGAIILYLNLALAFTSAFRMISELNPNAFTNYPAGQPETVADSRMLYFSFTCLTATGLGEVLPVHPLARSLTNLEAVTGQLYLTILLARLVTLHVASAPDER